MLIHTLETFAKGRRIVIFGTGEASKTFLYYHPHEIAYFVDNNASKWDTDFEGKTIKNPAHLLTEDKQNLLIVIASSYYIEISKGLVDLGFEELTHFVHFSAINFGQEFFAGHYYSPVPSLNEVRKQEDAIFDRSYKQLHDISLNEAEMSRVLREASAFYEEFPYKEDAKPNERFRYHFVNNFFEQADALMLYSMMRMTKPKRIIEIGSGFSSSLMLDVNDTFFHGEIELTFIEPYPDRLKSLIRPHEEASVKLIQKRVQDVEISIFSQLEAGDILFIDSSHVSKIGSDVNHILFHILPLLNKGVFIHIHDIFWAFEYPEEWIYNGMTWNEAYILRAFLQGNSHYEIRMWNDFVGRFYTEEVMERMPLFMKDTGSSFWMEKTGR